MTEKNGTDGKEMSFLEHLEELRWRVFKSLAVVLVFSIGAYFYTEYIIDFLAGPLPQQELIFLNPTDAFLVRLKTAIICGVFIGLPFIFYHLWRFVAPGLYATEKKYLLSFVFFATLFFLGGAAFAFYGILPLGIKFLMGFQTKVLKPNLAVNEYFGFIFKLFMAFGIVFELPLVSFFLTKIGLIRSSFIRTKRRYSYVIIFIAAAFLTPPDPFTQVMMALPLLVLYEVSIWVSRLAEHK